jgi:lysophospholipase L1-like esterase
MNQLTIVDCKDKIRWIGRTYDETEQKVTYFNWTCAGLEFEFTGNYLLAEVCAYSAIEFEGMTPNAPKRVIWPWIAVFLDDGEEPIRRMEIGHEQETCLIYASEQIETHRIKIIKITENAKGKVGIKSFLMEGEMNSIPQDNQSKRYIEFIGDSITCGFGNETTEKERFFYSGEENGWMSHAAIAARKLQFDYSIVAASGITVGEGIGVMKWPLSPMNQTYQYTDRYLEEVLESKEPFKEWDFTMRIPDIIIINLGTNDSSLIAFEGDYDKGEYNFENNYYSFIKNIRELNGPKPLIICALGSMDYYLYSNIEKTVARYSTETMDENIKCFRYGKINFLEGYGAAGHPSVASHKRMGEELANYIIRSVHY